MDKNEIKIIDDLIRENNLDGQDCLKLANFILANFDIPQLDCIEMLASWYFAKKDAVNCLIACSYYCDISNENYKLFNIVYEYFHEFIDEAKENYEYNARLLEGYQWYNAGKIPNYDNLSNVTVYQNDKIVIYMNKSTGNMNLVTKDNIEISFSPQAVVLAAGVNCISSLECIKNNLEAEVYKDAWAKRPFYIYHKNKNDFALVLQTGKLDSFIAEQNTVFFISWDNAAYFLSDMQSYLVDKVVCGEYMPIGGKYNLDASIRNIKKEKENYYLKIWQENILWYHSHKQLIKQNVKSGKPKVLFVTTRFSTAVQYHTRDCLETCQRLGCSVKLVKEKSDIHAIYFYESVKVINEFKPDIIFCIDHFRLKKFMPKEIIHVCWAQDHLPHIIDRNTPARLDENQYIIAHYPPKEELCKIGYDERKIMKAPVPANDKLYCPYKLTTEEYEKYCADIILVAHGGCYANHIKKFRAQYRKYGQPVLDICEKIFDKYYELAYNEQITRYSHEDLYKFFKSSLREESQNYILSEEAIQDIAEHFYSSTGTLIFRSVLAEWLIDGGYTNIKLYGNEWDDNPKFAPYAMGAAQNGEPLAKIYQSAKITLGSNPATTGTARFYECYLSGGFYIANYIEPDADYVNLRDNFTQDKEVPFYYNRQDLYDKIDYYLANPQECKKVTQHVREKMLQTSTYEALMKNMLQWLSEKVSEKAGD